MAADADTPHYPQPASVEALGKGGFRFAGMSHRGSLLFLPSGVWAWPVTVPSDITESTLARALAEGPALDMLLLGTGQEPWIVPEALRWRFRDSKITVEAMRTAHAANTYNILLGEGRRVGAALIAVP